jgi:hypothetical protein
MGADPDFPNEWPRDGRMRRKNMLQTDSNLSTLADHLNGVDLNRNNPPYWNSSNGSQSSANTSSLIHHGQSPRSEPEVHALDAAAALGPASQLRIYTDVHSYSQVHFWVRSSNTRLAQQTQQVLQVFSDHHQAFPAGKRYIFNTSNLVALNSGIGTTDEYFTHEYEVPSWTLEVEPTGGQQAFFPQPGGGADYGGAGVNGHDGFILPESQIRRVREQLAQSFAAVYYRQSGPPNVQAARIVDVASGAVVFEATRDPADDAHRLLFQRQHQALVLGRDYDLWVAFNKPMRWLDDNGNATGMPGINPGFYNTFIDMNINGTGLELAAAEVRWNTAPGDAPDGYLMYRTDAMTQRLTLAPSAANQAAASGGADATLRLFVRDLTAMTLDTNPASVASWSGGHWVGYENEHGVEADVGGRDTTLLIAVSDQPQDEPFLVTPGIAASWYDPAHSGEGFVIQTLADGRAVMFWFTYDDLGDQDWYLAEGQVRGNRLLFPEVRRYSGGVFGAGFDPAKVSSEVMGSARFSWTDCNSGYMDWHLGNRRARQQLTRLSNILGLDCQAAGPVPQLPNEALLSGAWYDPTHSGEGYAVDVLSDGRAVVYWFSYGPDGTRRWFMGVGAVDDGKLVFDEMITTRGGIFGDDFDPATVQRPAWGSLVLDMDCAGGTASYSSTEAGFGAGALNIVKLIDLDGIGCSN